MEILSDSLYRLTAAGTWDGDTMEYGYDENGNMTEARRVKDGAVREIQTYTLYSGTSPHGGMNRLQRIGFDMNGDGDVLDNGDYVMTMGYDGNGNMISRDFDYVDTGTPDVEWDYDYDALGRMVRVSHGAELVAEYGYDALGRRAFKKKAGEPATAFFYDREDVVEEYDAGGSAVARSFLHGPGVDDYVSMTEAGGGKVGTYFYHIDGMGSVTDMTTQAGSALSTRYQYAAFGKATADGTYNALSGLNPYEYTGRRYDPEGEIMYYRSRYYDPTQRRFLQEDRWAGSLSRPLTYIGRYAYVKNNPTTYIDPFGLTWSENLTLVGLWATGTGPDNWTFLDGTNQVEDMKDAWRVNEARGYFYEKNRSRFSRGEPLADVTNYSGAFGLEGLLRAGFDPTEQFVGGYRIDICVSADGKFIEFILTNTTSLKSGSYRLLPSHEKSSLGPLGNMTQTYRWEEPINFNFYTPQPFAGAISGDLVLTGIPYYGDVKVFQ